MEARFDFYWEDGCCYRQEYELLYYRTIQEFQEQWLEVKPTWKNKVAAGLGIVAGGLGICSAVSSGTIVGIPIAGICGVAAGIAGAGAGAVALLGPDDEWRWRNVGSPWDEEGAWQWTGARRAFGDPERVADSRCE